MYRKFPKSCLTIPPWTSLPGHQEKLFTGMRTAEGTFVPFSWRITESVVHTLIYTEYSSCESLGQLYFHLYMIHQPLDIAPDSKRILIYFYSNMIVASFAINLVAKKWGSTPPTVSWPFRRLFQVTLQQMQAEQFPYFLYTICLLVMTSSIFVGCQQASPDCHPLEQCPW